jgi:hypothetical protein
MKVVISKVSGLTHDELVDLFCTATYGSSWLCISAENARDLVEDGDCREDVWAKALLNGREIVVTDYYAEGERYGKLPCVIDPLDGDCANYTVTLKDVENGLKKCFNHKDAYIREYADYFREGGGNMDLQAAETLMQIIVFGEHIYG